MRLGPSLLALSVALAASLLPAAAHAEETSSAPAAVETSPRWLLVGVGAGVFAVSYGVSAFVAATASNVTDADHSGYAWMAVPVVGPFVTPGQAPLKRDEKVTIPALGVVQVIGLGLAAAGFVFPKTKESPTAASTAFVPGGPQGSAGAMVVGTF
jgi:hypothetical protein